MTCAMGTIILQPSLSPVDNGYSHCILTTQRRFMSNQSTELLSLLFPKCRSASASENLRVDDVVVHSQTNAVYELHNCYETQLSQVSDSLSPNKHGKDKDVERALQQQAQLIGRYEEEERVQRDWEDKLRRFGKKAFIV